MKRLRVLLGMVCFIAGFLTLIAGVLATLVSLYAFSVDDMQRLHHRPFSELLLAAVPGVVIALVGIALLICSRSLDEHGPVRRYDKRMRI
jgi:di/tricarboxylate transporter